ncbi:MAG: orotate phosphoribosyltransferase [Pseudomonadota bacterium]
MNTSSSIRDQFLSLCEEVGALRFGEFTLKSGRVSPYFFNAGLFSTGEAIAKLGSFYAHTIVERELEVDMLFGPAYKGIPLVTATAAALATEHKRNLPFAFNRKEAKDHGEGGHLVGAPLAGRVLVVDDVITAGTALRESVQIIRAQDADPAAVLIALDRQERGQGELSAIDEAQRELGLQIASVASLHDLTQWLRADGNRSQILQSLEDYRARYGVQ